MMNTISDWNIIHSPADYPAQDTVCVFIGKKGKVDIGFINSYGWVVSLSNHSPSGKEYRPDTLFCYTEFKLPDDVKQYLADLQNQKFGLSRFLPTL